MGGVGMERFKLVTHEMASCEMSEASGQVINIPCGFLNRSTRRAVGVDGNFMVMQLFG